VDNRSTEPEVLAYYDELAGNERVTLVHYDKPFNYSEAINLGVAQSTADVVVLLNNDMLVTDAGWLHELVQWAVQPGIGVVGGKLLHRNNTIQHAGIILGMNGFIGHLYLNAPEHYHGLAGSVDWYRDLHAVTGACQAVRRALFLQVGGYDERFRLAFGDIDFCLRVVKAGCRNLYNPFARLTHFEGGSRGYETPVKDILLAYDELLPWVEKHDPYYSPNLTYQPIPQCNSQSGEVDARLQNIKNRRRSLSKS
jgi:GT2 family glycosyltransferase